MHLDRQTDGKVKCHFDLCGKKKKKKISYVKKQRDVFISVFEQQVRIHLGFLFS